MFTYKPPSRCKSIVEAIPNTQAGTLQSSRDTFLATGLATIAVNASARAYVAAYKASVDPIDVDRVFTFDLWWLSRFAGFRPWQHIRLYFNRLNCVSKTIWMTTAYCRCNKTTSSG